MSTSATASSSKRAASSAAPTTPAPKRARPSPSEKGSEAPEDDDLDGDDNVAEGDMNDEAKAKAQRREARTIRNRESAQRSRNQRKAHLAWLEQRVVELENENRALRTGTAPSTPSKTRESSPANSIVSLASDLGIPPEIVSAGGGVNLATVAPPPADLLEDIKPVVPADPIEPVVGAVMPQLPTELASENAALRWRVGMLENIVKQAANYFSSHTPIDHHSPVPSHGMIMVDQAYHHPQQPAVAPGMEATLSPPLYPTAVHEAVQSPLRLQTQLDVVHTNTHHQTTVQQPTAADAVSSFVDLSTPVARHPAVVATWSSVSSLRRDKALQRARGSLTATNWDLPANRQRLSVVARVVVALARLRGWTSASPARPSRATAARQRKTARRAGFPRAHRLPNGTRR